MFTVRLACLIHAASVRSEPESNSPTNYLEHLACCQTRSADLKLIDLLAKIKQGLVLDRTIQISKNVVL